MQFDNTGTFQVLSVPPNGEYAPLERLQRCTLCYGKTNEKSFIGLKHVNAFWVSY